MSDITSQIYPLFLDDVDRVTVLKFLKLIDEDPEFRAACEGLGNLSAGIPEEERLDRMVDMLELFLTTVDPPEEAKLSQVFAPNFLKNRKLRPWRWVKHLSLDTSSGLLSAHLAVRVEALAGLWGVTPKVLSGTVPKKNNFIQMPVV